MTKGLFALSVAAILLISSSSLADDATVGLRTGGASASHDAHPQSRSWETLQLPAIPHLDTIPWARSDQALRGPKLGVLPGGQPDTLAPLLVQPPTSPRDALWTAPPLRK
jgi:hypothetical protein